MVDTAPTQQGTNAAAREISPEHSPLTALDEFLVHNSPQPIRVMYTTDVRTYERLWFTCQDRTGDLYVVTGLGFYPNLNTAEAYSIVVLRGQHTYVHAHRRLGDNRMNMRVGPINFELVESFKDWHLTLADNTYGIAYDLHWYDTKRAVYHQGFGMAGLNPTAIPADTTAGYETFGRPEGWVTVNGERFRVDTGAFMGSRDHHWGTRDGVGGKARSRSGGGQGGDGPAGGQWVEFEDWSIWGPRNLYSLGDPRPGTGRYLRSERRLKFHPESHLFTEGIITNYLDDGSTKEVYYRRLGNQIAFLRCGMYGGRQGGTPDGDIWHGMYVGDDVVGGGSYDANKPEVQALLAGLDDHHCEVSCGSETTYGIFEPYEPVCWEACRDGRPGYALLE